MAFLFHDIVLDDTAFKTASDDMASLKHQAANLKPSLKNVRRCNKCIGYFGRR